MYCLYAGATFAESPRSRTDSIFMKKNRVFYTLHIPFARGPFALNNYTIGPMTTNRKVMYDFSIIKYWEAFADEK